MSMDQEILDYCASLPSEETLEECSNGVDEDGNGFIDCQDYSCSMSDDPEVFAYCDEQLENSLEKCHNGFDDDDNGFSDCADFSCADFCTESLAAAGKTPNDQCSDGEDNDADGFVDCEDWDCSYDPLVTACDGPGICAM